MVALSRYNQQIKHRFHRIIQRAGDANPKRLALTFSAGVTIGLMPIPWGTMVICALVALMLKLNQLVIQGFNYLVYPLQIVLMPFLILLGDRLFSSSDNVLSIDALRQSLQSPSADLLYTLGRSLLHGVALWACLVPVLAPLLYLGSQRLIKQLLAKAPVAAPLSSCHPQHTEKLDL